MLFCVCFDQVLICNSNRKRSASFIVCTLTIRFLCLVDSIQFWIVVEITSVFRLVPNVLGEYSLSFVLCFIWPGSYVCFSLCKYLHVDKWNSESCQLDSELDFIYVFSFGLVRDGIQSQHFLAEYYVTFLTLDYKFLCL